MDDAREVSWQGPWVAATQRAALQDPLSYRSELSCYWSEPSQGLTLAGYGIAGLLLAGADRALRPLAWLESGSPILWEDDGLPRPPGPFLGGLAFDLSRPLGALWAGFTHSRWVLPELLLWRSDGEQLLTAFVPVKSGRAQALAGARARLSSAVQQASSFALPVARPPASVQVSSSREHWDALVERALKSIQSGALTKVVAARALRVCAGGALDVRSVLRHLESHAPRCATFLFQGADGSSFLGATPERLCRVLKGAVDTEALASSAPPREAASLAHGDKERREHGAVIDGILAALRPLCDQVGAYAEPRLLELPYVSHLWTPVQGTLRSGVTASQVVAALHPTPAVGGTPTAGALRFISEWEGLQRGWYAGAVGWAGQEGLDLRVAIRSALVRGDQAHAFVGAGIVHGSLAEKEWAETEAKSRPMLSALEAAHG